MKLWHVRRHVRGMFRRFNRRYFDGRLAEPEIRIVPAGQAGTLVDGSGDWGALGRGPGGEWLLELRGVGADVHRSYLAANLLHEMIHLSIGPEHDHRSQKWRAEVDRLSRAGALRETI